MELRRHAAGRSGGLLVAGSLTVALFSPAGCAGSLFWGFDLLSHFRVQYLVCGALGALVAAAVRERFAFWLCLVAGLGNAVLVAPLFWGGDDGRQRGRVLSIVSFNTWRHHDDWDSIAPVLGPGETDVIYLTETHAAVRRAVAELEPGYDVFRASSEVLLFRRASALSPTIATAPAVTAGRGMVASFFVGNEVVDLIAVHPPAPLSAVDARSRDLMFDAIGEFVRERDGAVIVVGDLNATPWSHGFRSLVDSTGLVNSQRGTGIEATWP